MSLETILTELSRLTEEEREVVERKLQELSVSAALDWLRRRDVVAPLPHEQWTKVFEESDKGEGDLPEDFSLNHDYYIHGVPKGK